MEYTDCFTGVCLFRGSSEDSGPRSFLGVEGGTLSPVIGPIQSPVPCPTGGYPLISVQSPVSDPAGEGWYSS